MKWQIKKNDKKKTMIKVREMQVKFQRKPALEHQKKLLRRQSQLLT